MPMHFRRLLLATAVACAAMAAPALIDSAVADSAWPVQSRL